LKETARAENV